MVARHYQHPPSTKWGGFCYCRGMKKNRFERIFSDWMIPQFKHQKVIDRKVYKGLGRPKKTDYATIYELLLAEK